MTNQAEAVGSDEVVLPQLRRMWWETGVEARSQAGMGAVARAMPAMIASAMRLAWQADRFGTAATIVLTVVSGALATLGLLTTQQVLIELFSAGPTVDRMRAALPSLLLLAGVLALRSGLGIAVGWVQTGLEPKVVHAAQRHLFEVTTSVDVAAFDEESFADEMERATGRGTDASMGLVESALNLLAGVIGLIAVAVALGVLHPLLIVVTITAMIPTGWAALHAGQQQYRAYLASSIRRRRLWILARLMADRKPAAELRHYGLRGFLLRQFDTVMGAETRHQMRLARQVTVTNTFGTLIGAVAALGIYATLAWLLLSGLMPLATAATAVVALQQAQGSLRLASFQIDALYSEGRHYRDFEMFLRRAHARLPQEPTNAVSAKVVEPLRAMRLDGITLSYPDRDQPAVHDVSFTLHKGQTIALVGENGSGKTTLAAIISGLRAPDQGTVSWNDDDLSELDIKQVQSRIAVVTQDHHRWPFSAGVNIRLGDTGRDSAPDPAGPGQEEHAQPASHLQQQGSHLAPRRGEDRRPRISIEAAARLAAAHDMIIELPRGYDTLLDRTFEGGQDLSGGQWQRLVAARGFFREADLLIMDEPSSALDAKAEDHLFSVVRERRGRATTILITHRLANVRHADRIYVLDRGELVASGTHDELMNGPNPIYPTLFRLQAAGYAA